MAGNGSDTRRGRETRLLILVVGVSIAVLMLLARFRYPAADLNVVTAPAPSPLAGLASQAAFDDMARTMNQLLSRISPRLAAVELHRVPPSAPGPAPATSIHTGGEAPPAVEDVALAQAFVVRPGLALLHVPSDFLPVSFVDSGGAAIEIATLDAAREIALVRVSPAADMRLEPAAEGFAGFAYVGLVAPTKAGPTIQPRFVGRLTPLSDGRWPGALSIEGGPVIPPGALMFAIDGRFIGVVVGAEKAPVLVPAAMVEAFSVPAPAGVARP